MPAVLVEVDDPLLAMLQDSGSLDPAGRKGFGDIAEGSVQAFAPGNPEILHFRIQSFILEDHRPAVAQMDKGGVDAVEPGIEINRGGLKPSEVGCRRRIDTMIVPFLRLVRLRSRMASHG